VDGSDEARSKSLHKVSQSSFAKAVLLMGGGTRDDFVVIDHGKELDHAPDIPRTEGTPAANAEPTSTAKQPVAARKSTTEAPAKPPLAALKSAARRDSAKNLPSKTEAAAEKDFDAPAAVRISTPASNPCTLDKAARQVVAPRSTAVISTSPLVLVGTSGR
jgi:hypothetical protein